jgi:hypothetical protein
MIDIYVPAGIVSDVHDLATAAAATVMKIEQVPDISMFRENTAAFIHEYPATNISDVNGSSDHVRVQVLTTPVRLIARSSWRSSNSSRPWWPMRRVIRSWPAGPGCC